jgi:hypothetical protein
MMVQTRFDKKQDPISKIIRVKRAGHMAQVVEHLPSKCEDLSSIPALPDKKEKEGRKEGREGGKGGRKERCQKGGVTYPMSCNQDSVGPGLNQDKN